MFVGGVSEKGIKFTLHITSEDDLSRDLLKVCSIFVLCVQDTMLPY